MEKQDDFKLFGFILRRVALYLLVGLLFGALWGAICVGLAGAIIGISLALLDTSPFGIGSDRFEIATVGGCIGLLFGSITGGAIGLLSLAIWGAIAPPSRALWPAKAIVVSMLKTMATATSLGVVVYFMWSAVFGLFRAGFVESLQDGLFYAMYGVPLLMGLGQIAGVCRSAAKLKALKSSPVQSEM